MGTIRLILLLFVAVFLLQQGDAKKHGKKNQHAKQPAKQQADQQHGKKHVNQHKAGADAAFPKEFVKDPTEQDDQIKHYIPIVLKGEKHPVQQNSFRTFKKEFLVHLRTALKKPLHWSGHHLMVVVDKRIEELLKAPKSQSLREQIEQFYIMNSVLKNILLKEIGNPGTKHRDAVIKEVKVKVHANKQFDGIDEKQVEHAIGTLFDQHHASGPHTPPGTPGSPHGHGHGTPPATPGSPHGHGHGTPPATPGSPHGNKVHLPKTPTNTGKADHNDKHHIDQSKSHHQNDQHLHNGGQNLANETPKKPSQTDSEVGPGFGGADNGDLDSQKDFKPESQDLVTDNNGQKSPEERMDPYKDVDGGVPESVDGMEGGKQSEIGDADPVDLNSKRLPEAEVAALDGTADNEVGHVDNEVVNRGNAEDDDGVKTGEEAGEDNGRNGLGDDEEEKGKVLYDGDEDVTGMRKSSSPKEGAPQQGAAD